MICCAKTFCVMRAAIRDAIFSVDVWRKRMITMRWGVWLLGIVQERLDESCDAVVTGVGAVETLVHGRRHVG